MLKKRDAQGLPINVIIMAVIALIILVILIAIFTGQMSNFFTNVQEVQTCDEICRINGYTAGEADSTQEGYEILVGARDGDGKQCYCKS